MKRHYLSILLLLPNLLLAIEPEDIAEDFFDNLSARSYSRAIDCFFTGNKRMTSEHVDTVKSQISNHLGSVGYFHDYELIHKETHTKYFHTYTYLIRYEKELVFAQLLFYKPKARWMGYNVFIHGNENEIRDFFYRKKLVRV